MSMSFTIHVWHVLLLLNVIAVIVYLAWPRRGAADLGSAIAGGLVEMIILGLMTISSLLMWLIYALTRLGMAS
jgi:hypothetical protein